MIEHQEAWQVYDHKGEPIIGQSVLPVDARKDHTIIVGGAHIWIWRRTGNIVEVLLQRRAKDKPTWPDHLGVSVAGHIDAGETVLQAAIREGHEEIGIDFNTSDINFLFCYRNFKDGLRWVYLYEYASTEEFSLNDGEADSVEWVELSTFRAMTLDPAKYTLVPHPAEYFSNVLIGLDHFLNEDHVDISPSTR